jgi:AIG1 family
LFDLAGKSCFLIGTTGAGKSTLGNLLIGEEVFHVDPTKTGTLYPQSYCTEWGLEKQVIWDTPGLSDGKNRDALFLSELTLVVDRVQLAAAVVLVVRSAARIPAALTQALEKYIDLFGPQLSKVLYIVVNDSSRVFPPEEIDMYNMTVAEQLNDELGLEMEPGFLLQIPTNRADIPLQPELMTVQRYNIQWLKQAVLGSRPVLTRMGHQTIESLLALRTTLEPRQQQFYRKQLLEQSGRQREGLQLMLSRADVRKAFFSKRGYVLIQTFDLSATSRVMQVLQGMDSRVQQRRELRITPDSIELGKEIANGLQLRKKHYSSRKEVRATTPEDVFSVLNDLGLVLIPLSAPVFSNGAASSADSAGEAFAAARPGDKVSQRTLKAIADVLTNTSTTESVVKLVQTCIQDSLSAGASRQ